MRHLITGGSGYLGSLIARRLRERGDEVRVLDVWDDPSRPPDIEFVLGDVTDRDAVAAAVAGIDIVHHNAALVPLAKSGRGFQRVNADGTRIVAQEAARAGARTFVQMSSSAVFARQRSFPITTETPPSPAEAYGRSKLAGELAAQEVCRRHGLALVIVRPRTILSAGRLGIFQVLFDWVRESRRIYVIGSGNVKFQFVHADDLMRAYMLAVDQSGGGAFNVGTDRFGTLREALEHLIGYAGTSSRVTALPAGLVRGAMATVDFLGLSPLGPYHALAYGKEYHFDLAPLHALGWRAQYSNDEMFRESFDWFMAHREQLTRDPAASAHRKGVSEGILRILRRLS